MELYKHYLIQARINKHIPHPPVLLLHSDCKHKNHQSSHHDQTMHLNITYNNNNNKRSIKREWIVIHQLISLNQIICCRKRFLPAKLIFARWGACNVHATLVFLNWPLTLWAGLGIGQYPENHIHRKVKIITIKQTTNWIVLNQVRNQHITVN